MTQNIYQQLGLKQVINACGKMTILGVSSVAPEVMQATARAASAFVEIDRLVDSTGERGLSPAAGLPLYRCGGQLYHLLRLGGNRHRRGRRDYPWRPGASDADAGQSRYGQRSRHAPRA